MRYKHILFGIFAWGFSLFSLSPVSAYASTELIFRESCDGQTCKEFEVINEEFVRYGSSFKVGDTFSVDIIIKNPQAIDIFSVSSWVKYDPKIFTLQNLEDKGSAFGLAAPGEFQDDPTLGEIKIARAVAGFPVSEVELKVATLMFVVKSSPNNASLSFWDYQENGEGKTSVLTIENILPKNILLTEPRALQFSGASSPAPSQTPIVNDPVATPSTTPEVEPTITIEVAPDVSVVSQDTIPTISDSSSVPSFIDIPRPEGLRARTNSDGQIELLWQFGEDPRIQGYFIYYDQNSSLYMHRRDVGRTNNYTFPKSTFEKGKRMYFAIKAYDITGKTSDFSDEVYLVVGTLGSESHPFSGELSSAQKNLGADILSSVISDDKYMLDSNMVNTDVPSTGSPVDIIYIGGFFGSLIGLLLLRAIWRRRNLYRLSD